MPRLCRVRNSKQVSTVITLLTISAHLVKSSAHTLMSSAGHDKSARLRVKVIRLVVLGGWPPKQNEYLLSSVQHDDRVLNQKLV